MDSLSGKSDALPDMSKASLVNGGLFLPDIHFGFATALVIQFTNQLGAIMADATMSLL
jgi:hypothetical protein